MPKLSAEKRALVEAAIEEGWSLIEIYRTYHVHRDTVIRNFGYRGWDRKQSAQFGAQMLHSSYS